MKTRINHYWELFRSSYWVIPAMMMIFVIVLAEGLHELDARYGQSLLKSFPWLVKGGVEGSRNILSTTASSVLTIAGVTFSATMVTLALASSQFGPRLLRQFIRSFPSQFTLAVQVNTAIYCLLVLRHLPDLENGNGLPISTSTGIILAVLSLAMFVYFVHHVAVSIQGERIVARVHQDLEEAIKRYFRSPKRTEEHDRGEVLPDLSKEKVWEVLSSRDGYLQAVELAYMIEIAKRHSLVCRLMVAPGHYIMRDSVLVTVRGRDYDSTLAKSLSELMLLGPVRTPEQDYEYAVRLLVEVALRAMSPGINDPFTAIHCIDCLGASFVKIIQRHLPRRLLTDAEGVVRVELPPTTFEEIGEMAFAPLRQISYKNPEVAKQLLIVLQRMGSVALNERRKLWVRHQAHVIHRGVTNTIEQPEDRQKVDDQMKVIEIMLKSREEAPEGTGA